MSIVCGHCNGRHESVREVRECSSTNPTDIEQEVAAIVTGDPWEGATESEPGVWSPGPAAYLDQRRNPGQIHETQGGFGGPTADEIRQQQWDEMLKELEPGYYALNEEEIYEVVLSKAGRKYAKLLNWDTGRWNYEAGAITKLKPTMRMKLEQAAKYGKATGRCLVCGRELTNPESIELGIGPICASRF
jgi:hypothetical protein